MNGRTFSKTETKKLIENLNITIEGIGRIISQVHIVESFLDDILETYFCGKGLKGYQFYNLILRGEFFTLHQKINVFSKLGFHREPKFKDKFKGLTRRLNEANNIRNKMAHRINIEKIIDSSKDFDNPKKFDELHIDKYKIRMNNKEKTIIINDEFLNEFEEFINNINKDLVNVMADSDLKSKYKMK